MPKTATTTQAKQEIECAAEEAVKVIAKATNEASKAIADTAIEAKKILNSNSGGGFSNLLYKQISLWTGVASLIGIFIGGFLYLTNPSRDNDTALQLQDQRITSQQETIDKLTKIQQNDTQEVKSAVKELVDQIQLQQQDITKLTTIIEERIPAKK